MGGESGSVRGHAKKASVGTAAMGGGHRRKSSAAPPTLGSLAASSSPAVLGSGSTRARRKRSVTDAGLRADSAAVGFGEILVVEAPQDASPLNSPAKLEHRESWVCGGKGSVRSEGEDMVVGGLEGVGGVDS
jgi:hypothetical protein